MKPLFTWMMLALPLVTGACGGAVESAIGDDGSTHAFDAAPGSDAEDASGASSTTSDATSTTQGEEDSPSTISYDVGSRGDDASNGDSDVAVGDATLPDASSQSDASPPDAATDSTSPLPSDAGADGAILDSSVDANPPEDSSRPEDSSPPDDAAPEASTWLNASSIDASAYWPNDAGACAIPPSAWTTPPLEITGPPETPPTATTVTPVSLVTSALAYNATNGLLYATTPASAGANGNSLVTIDPWTAVQGSPAFIGSGPNAVTVSDDGHYVYVALSGTQQIQRYDAIAQSLDILFPFAPLQASESFAIASLYPLASSADSVIAEVGQDADDWTYQNVLVFDDSTARANQVTQLTGGSPYVLGGPLIPSGADALWFAPDGVFPSMQYLCMNDAGVFLANSIPFTGGFQKTPATFGSGELTALAGDVYDAKSMTHLGSYGLETTNYYPMQVLDEGFGRVTFLVGVYDDLGKFENDTLLTFDQATRSLVSQVDFSPSSDQWPTALVRFGQYGFAVLYYSNETGGIDLIRSPLLQEHP